MQKTYELTIEFQDVLDPDLKDKVISWLARKDVHSFVEGVADGLDLDPDYRGGRDDLLFDAAMERRAPILIYNFDQLSITGLAEGLTAEFGERIRLSTVEMDTDSWQKGWQAHFHPISTRKFLIYPPWLRGDASTEALLREGDRIAIEIEPGMAFGTGQHESTQLCLEILENWLETASLAGKRVLDVGTGSGILAIAACKAGADSVYGSDVEEDAVAAAAANAAANNVEVQAFLVGRQGTMTPSGVPKTYDFVFANILLPVLLEMKTELSAICPPGGFLVVSGILRDQCPEIIDCYAQDFQLIQSVEKNDWSGMLLRRG